MSTLKSQVEKLINAAAAAKASHDALHLSQAALNAANAMRVMADTDRLPG